MIIEYKDFNEEEIISLYDSVGWSAYTRDKEALMKGFDNSLKILAYYDDEKLVGLIRVVGDGHTIVFIQDIIVNPTHQRKGIGTILIKEIIKLYLNVRQIELTTDNISKNIEFYNSLGFKEFSKLGLLGFIKD